MFRQIRKTLANSHGKISFNMGEMLDSLALDHITNLTTMLIPFFSDFHQCLSNAVDQKQQYRQPVDC